MQPSDVDAIRVATEGFMLTSVFLIVAYGVFFAWACSNVAEAKGYGAWAWAFVGLLFGVFGLLAAAAMPKATIEQTTRRKT